MDEREMPRVPLDQSYEDWFHDALSKGLVSARSDADMQLAWQAARRTTPDREAIVEEIAEMVDHMGEGRRLEEYVGAIREMKTAPTSDKGGA